MAKELPNLYHDIIKQHHKHPYHYDKRPDADVILQAYNPLCGDRFNLYLFLSGQRVNEVYFHGYGCSVSRAANSVLAKSMEGKTLSEGISLCENYLNLVLPDNIAPTKDELSYPDFEAFRAAKAHPGRTSCASLSWETMHKLLLEHQKVSNSK